MDTIQLKRIADAIEEILRLVKKDMELYLAKEEVKVKKEIEENESNV